MSRLQPGKRRFHLVLGEPLFVTMCHWKLRVWKCGESYFTKYSSCSFDRAVHSPDNPLNPLHSSIAPIGLDDAQPLATNGNNVQPRRDSRAASGRGRKVDNRKTRVNTNGRSINSQAVGPGAVVSRPPLHHMADPSTYGPQTAPASSSASSTNYARDAHTGEVIPVPLSEVGKASRFGDRTLGEAAKCHVFEVVLQSQEPTICPACARSPKRAKLPAHARGCYGLS
ncbi:hypothetical protein EJ04DRAFT_523112 [Polyplosphaeria fusca]|uniref:Uncharacterized protein n=1 Tax=Polyplosphaeria fusca TaxID=682080 RepID=A0A9P4R1N3_9PLEO|nr:hypothetical protein EJ04DRAFT_523112 [Polyplosphaeria fusca]